jgi:hypothetical protein
MTLEKKYCFLEIATRFKMPISLFFCPHTIVPFPIEFKK